MTRAVAIALVVATAVAGWLAGPAAWGHTFPAVRTVVVQVERCDLVLMVGYKPASGAATSALIAQASTSPKSQAGSLRDVMMAYAMAPLEVGVGGHKLAPTSVQAKVAVEPGGARPMVVVLVTYALTGSGTLAITTREPRTTRFSWQDRASGRVDLETAPTQDEWFNAVASFLLKVQATTCAPTAPSSSGSSLPAPSLPAPTTLTTRPDLRKTPTLR